MGNGNCFLCMLYALVEINVGWDNAHLPLVEIAVMVKEPTFCISTVGKPLFGIKMYCHQGTGITVLYTASCSQQRIFLSCFTFVKPCCFCIPRGWYSTSSKVEFQGI